MEAKMSVGQFVFMLHSHLPYYRKAGMWPFGEENLYECMAETYVPLLNAISELYDEGIKAKLTVGITPILAEQLNDRYLQEGFVKYLNSLHDESHPKTHTKISSCPLIVLLHLKTCE